MISGTNPPVFFLKNSIFTAVEIQSQIHKGYFSKNKGYLFKNKGYLFKRIVMCRKWRTDRIQKRLSDNFEQPFCIFQFSLRGILISCYGYRSDS